MVLYFLANSLFLAFRARSSAIPFPNYSFKAAMRFLDLFLRLFLSHTNYIFVLNLGGPSGRAIDWKGGIGGEDGEAGAL